MDRRSRRFSPTSEDLEGRQLLSTAASTVTNPLGVTAAPGVQVDGSAIAQQTIEAKVHRITNLPYFVGLLNKDHAVPQPAVANIQADLLALVGQLHKADSSLVSEFNHDLRKAQPYLNITPRSNEALNRDFGAVLISAGARADVVVDLQKNLQELVNFDSTQSGSTIAATNHYATILQVALQNGQPLATPSVPALLGSDHQGNHGKIPITRNHQPSLTGTYAYGTNIQIVGNETGVVLGRGAVDKATGTFTVKFDNYLPDGTYSVRIRSEDSGFLSHTSPKLTFEVVTPPIRK